MQIAVLSDEDLQIIYLGENIILSDEEHLTKCLVDEVIISSDEVFQMRYLPENTTS